MSEPMAASNPSEMREALRRLIAASGMSRRKFDELAQLPDGYTDKLLMEPPMRNIGPRTFFPMLWALRCRIMFVPDPSAKAKIEADPQFETRDERKARGDDHWRNAKVLSMVVEQAKITGSKGGKARAKKLTKLQRNKIAKLAANARWRAHRRRLRLEQESRSKRA
jgi:hypothetical protein